MAVDQNPLGVWSGGDPGTESTKCYRLTFGHGVTSGQVFLCDCLPKVQGFCPDLTLRSHSRYPSELHLNRNHWTKRILPVPAPIGVNFIPFPSSQKALNSPSSTSPSSFKRTVSANVSLLLCLGILSARSKRELLQTIIEPIS